VLGWYSAPFDDRVYTVLMLVTGTCAVGLVPSFIRARSDVATDRPTLRVTLLCLAVVLSLLPVAVLERLSYFEYFSFPQGRYLLVVVAPIAVLFALGARGLLPRRLMAPLPLSAAWALALFVLDAYVFVDTFVPNYVTRAVG
jgi:hypothetical protein